MTHSTLPSLHRFTAREETTRERLRSVLPVTFALSLIFGVVLTIALLLGDLLDLGAWALSQR